MPRSASVDSASCKAESPPALKRAAMPLGDDTGAGGTSRIGGEAMDGTLAGETGSAILAGTVPSDGAAKSERSLTTFSTVSAALRATFVPNPLHPGPPMLHERHRNAIGARPVEFNRPAALEESSGKFDVRHRRHPFCPLAHRLSAYWRCADGPVQLALCAPHWRQDAAAHRGHGPRTLHRGGDGGDHRRTDLARPALGRRADLAISSARRVIAK